MIKDKNFEFYTELKQKLHFLIEGVEYNKIISHDIGRISFKQDYPKFTRDTINDFIYTIDINSLYNLMKNNSNAIVYSVDRKDYEFQILQTIENVKSADYLLLSNLPRKKSFNPLLILKTFFQVIIKLNFFKYDLNSIVFLTSRIVYYRSIHLQLNKYFDNFDFSKKRYISFNSAYTVENLITQFFNLKGCETMSLSHSFFVNYKKFIPLDIINGENIVSKKILVWGESSKSDLNQNFGIHQERILISGNPKYKQKLLNVKQTFNNCIVLLGRVIYHETNIEIINILKKFTVNHPNIQFHLKLHLSLNYDLYKKLCEGTKIKIISSDESLTDLFKTDNYDFAIVNNSTTYYEAMYYDLVCFRYEISENEDFKGLDDKFVDEYSLSEKIERFKSISNVLLNNNINKLLAEVLGMGINRYKELFSNE